MIGTIATVALLLSARPGVALQESSFSLTSLTPVGSNRLITSKSGKLVIGGEVYESYLLSDSLRYNVFDLGKKYTRLTGIMGIPDDFRGESEGTFNIYIDGQSILKGSIAKGTTKKVDIDLEDARSLKIELMSCAFVQPKIYTGKAVSTREGVRLKSPDDLEKVSGSVDLKWAAVDGAVSYGVSIVAVSVDSADDTTDRFIGFTVKNGRTYTKLDLSKLAPGKYRWSVVAFGDAKLLGTFSPERVFIVQR